MARLRSRGRRLARSAAVVTTLVLLLGCAPPPAPSPTAAPAKPAEAPTTAPSPAAAAPTAAAAPATAQSPAASPAAASSPAAAPSKPTAAAAESAKPAAGRRPEIDLNLSHTEVDPGETFTFHVQARSPRGVGSVWWWATSTDDDNLADTHPFDCAGATLCRKSYSVSTQDRGRIVIRAQARDTDGQLSDESNQELRVR